MSWLVVRGSKVNLGPFELGAYLGRRGRAMAKVMF